MQLSAGSCLPVLLQTGRLIRFTICIVGCFVLFCLFSRQSLYEVLAGLDFTVSAGMVFDLQQSSCLCFSSIGITHVKPTLWTACVCLSVCLSRLALNSQRLIDLPLPSDWQD